MVAGRAEKEVITGIVERVVFANKSNGFTVLVLRADFELEITVVGTFATVFQGAELEIAGSWHEDERFGEQFRATSYTEKQPPNAEGIKRYLGSGMIKGVGPSLAEQIVKRFGEQTMDILDHQPELLTEIHGIGKKKLIQIKISWAEQKEVKNVMLFLQTYSISPAFAAKIYERYKEESIEKVKENPYGLAEDVWGIGFRTADRIAQQLGFALDSPQRIAAGILFALEEWGRQGHCYANKNELLAEAAKLLQVNSADLEPYLVPLQRADKLVQEEDSYYLPEYYQAEIYCAKRIALLLKSPVLYIERPIDQIIAAVQEAEDISYDPIQIEAITTAMGAKVLILTGGPGTGKTTTTLGMIKAFQYLKCDVLLAAPTGRAAKRLRETTGMEAKTIHRLLEYSPEAGYVRNEDNPLRGDVLIIDEVSMVDIHLMQQLLKALTATMVLILVGDVDQLPSVGAGNVLKDLINAGKITTIQLSRIFRQAEKSAIVVSAHKVNHGEMLSPSNEEKGDLFFLQRGSSEEIAQLICELCKERLPKTYGFDPVRDIQVLTPMHKGVIGTENLNLLLQQQLNPLKKGKGLEDTPFRPGDKVMQIRNNYDKSVFNGDIGQVVEVEREERIIFVEFDEETVEYLFKECDELTLAYAITVHKSQGSEYPVIIAPVSTEHRIMLQRNLLYTCMTRAKKLLILIGMPKALSIAINNQESRLRRTKLAERLQKELEKTATIFFEED